MGLQKLLIIILIITAVDSLACKCPTRRIDKDADNAYDIVVGRVLSATPAFLVVSTSTNFTLSPNSIIIVSPISHNVGTYRVGVFP